MDPVKEYMGISFRKRHLKKPQKNFSKERVVSSF